MCLKIRGIIIPLGAVHFHLVAWYLETSLLAGAGVETSERALRERIVWRAERFPVGVSVLPGLHLIVEEGRGGICRYCSCSFLSICRSKTSVSVHSHSLIKNGSSPRIAGARERLCTRALTIGTDTRLMLTRPFLIRNCLANSRHPRSEIIEFSYDMVTSHSSIT